MVLTGSVHPEASVRPSGWATDDSSVPRDFGVLFRVTFMHMQLRLYTILCQHFLEFLHLCHLFDAPAPRGFHSSFQKDRTFVSPPGCMLPTNVSALCSDSRTIEKEKKNWDLISHSQDHSLSCQRKGFLFLRVQVPTQLPLPSLATTAVGLPGTRMEKMGGKSVFFLLSDPGDLFFVVQTKNKGLLFELFLAYNQSVIWAFATAFPSSLGDTRGKNIRNSSLYQSDFEFWFALSFCLLPVNFSESLGSCSMHLSRFLVVFSRRDRMKYVCFYLNWHQNLKCILKRLY